MNIDSLTSGQMKGKLKTFQNQFAEKLSTIPLSHLCIPTRLYAVCGVEKLGEGESYKHLIIPQLGASLIHLIRPKFMLKHV